VVCIIGLLTGVLNALLGIGGGAVLVPALALWAGYQQKEAQAASLWYVVPTSLFAGFLYKSGSLDVRLEHVAAMVAAAFVGAVIGAPLVKRIHQRPLRQVFAVALMCIALIMVVTASQPDIATARHVRYLVLTWTGLVAGFLGSLLGIGGGVIVVPALVMLGGFDQKVAQGMSLLYVVPTALLSALLYRFHVKIRIDNTQVVLMVAGGLTGAFVGYQLMAATRSQALRIIFAVALGVLGIFLILRARRARRKEHAPDWMI